MQRPAQKQDPPAEQPEKYITVKEAAAFLSIPPNTLYKKAIAREVKSYKCGGLRRFRLSDLQEYMQAHRIEPIRR